MVGTTVYLALGPLPVVLADLRATAVLRIEKGITFVSTLHKRNASDKLTLNASAESKQIASGAE